MTTYEFNQIADDVVKNAICKLENDGIEIEPIIRNINDKKIKTEINKIVENYFFKEKEYSEEQIMNEIDKLAQKNQKEKEHVISIYLARLVLLSFETEKQTNHGRFDYLNYLSFVLFLKDLESKDENSHRNIISENMENKKDFYDILENTGRSLFNDEANKGISTVFSFQEAIEKEHAETIKIQYTQDIYKSLKYKPLVIERIFYI